MNVEFFDKFNRDLDSVQDVTIKKAIKRIISIVERADSVYDMPNIKKLIGFKLAYRIRKDIYKVFP